jgi:hypothetical protein
MFGQDTGDLSWGHLREYKGTPDFDEEGNPYYIEGICEECGGCGFGKDGTCYTVDCSEKHGIIKRLSDE